MYQIFGVILCRVGKEGFLLRIQIKVGDINSMLVNKPQQIPPKFPKQNNPKPINSKQYPKYQPFQKLYKNYNKQQPQKNPIIKNPMDQQQPWQQEDQQDFNYNYDEQIDYMQELDQHNNPSVQQQQHMMTGGQYETKSLIQKIYKQCARINQLTNVGYDWSVVLYAKTRWSQNKCDEFIAGGAEKLKGFIGYVGGFVDKQGFVVEEDQYKKQCEVCKQIESNKVRNICGHIFCQQCWTDHLAYNLEAKPLVPFPPCMSQDCQIPMSLTICKLLSEDHYSLKQKFIEILCRCYAIENTSVKICKGRPGTTCTRCFIIETTKLLGVIVCGACDNLVCPRCGDQYHGTSNCKYIEKWHQIFMTTMGLIEYFSYQTCPNCKNGVQRIAGCNEMVCRCKTTFCYICGERWEPSHPNATNGADYCPNYKKIAKIYRERKVMEKNRVNKFCFKIQAVKEVVNTYDNMMGHITRFKANLPKLYKKFLECFKFHESQLKILEFYCNFMKKIILILGGETISSYFTPNDRSNFFCKRVSDQYSKIYNFIFQFIDWMHQFLQNPSKQRKQKELNELLKVKQNFEALYFEKVKQLQNVKQSIVKCVKDQFESDIFQ